MIKDIVQRQSVLCIIVICLPNFNNIHMYQKIFNFNLLVFGTCLIVKDNLVPRFIISSSVNFSAHMCKFFIEDFCSDMLSAFLSAIECK